MVKTKGLEEIRNPIRCEFSVSCKKYVYTEEQVDIIEKELKELEERREMMKRFNEACVPMILDNETEKKLEVLEIIYNSPFIIDSLAELGKLPREVKKRYLFGTITNAEVEKVEEFFKNGEK